MARIHRITIQKRSSWPRQRWCNHSPGATHPGMWSQVGLRKHHYKQDSGCDGIPDELFSILKDDAVKVLHSVCQQIWKTQQWSQDWKRSVFIPIPTPRVHSDSCPSSHWCHPAISSSVIPFSSCPQSLLASESFPVSQLFTWGGQSTGVSALASFLSKKSQDWLDLLAVQRTLKSLVEHHSSKASVLWCSSLFMVQLLHSFMSTGKTIALTRQTLSAK